MEEGLQHRKTKITDPNLRHPILTYQESVTKLNLKNVFCKN